MIKFWGKNSPIKFVKKPINVRMNGWTDGRTDGQRSIMCPLIFGIFENINKYDVMIQKMF